MSWLLLVVRVSVTNYVDILFKFKSIIISFIYSLSSPLLNAMAGIR